ncbi:hypothetical protein SEA_LEWAN_112 [Mycobacterium phage Lewan]|nr:hypothetical protein SEA_LEWAN_112 [Mycobacterium phage Lewan]
MVSDSTIAAVARLHNPALVDLSDAEVVQLVAEERDAHWRPARKTPDFRHLLVTDLVAYLMSRGLHLQDAEERAKALVDKLDRDWPLVRGG